MPPSVDLFCRVIDNLGDIGVMWRLARQLHEEKNWDIRLWVDRLASLATIEPRIKPDQSRQVCAGIEVRQWHESGLAMAPRPVVIAGFSCELPAHYIAQLAHLDNPIWIQLEYLSAEPWTASFHGLHSLRDDGLKPIFFFPGFGPATGGLLREQHLMSQRQAWHDQGEGPRWLSHLGVSTAPQVRLVSVFTYPHAPLHAFVEQLQQTGERFHLLIPSTTTVNIAIDQGLVTWQSLPFLSQVDYDKLLWSCDLNLVRGEDSFVRAIWAGRPLIWQIYPQADAAHHTKLQAWLDLAKPPSQVAQAMHTWADGALETDLGCCLTSTGWQRWCAQSQSLAYELAQQPDLATRLDMHVRQQTNSQNPQSNPHRASDF